MSSQIQIYEYINKCIYDIGNSINEDTNIYFSSCKAPVNIALIKYWGKIDENLNFPINDSLSITLDLNDLYTQTSIAMSKMFIEDRLWINDNEIDLKNCKDGKVYRVNRILYIFRSSIDWEKLCIIKKDWKIRICSKNNFPTSAGLASSASGFSAMVTCLARLFFESDKYSDNDSNVDSKYSNGLDNFFTQHKIKEFSAISRLGSGSSCRSLFGGFVKWVNYNYNNNFVSQAEPVDTTKENFLIHNMKVLILVTNASQKHIDSTKGMKLSVKTSQLLNYRSQYIVPDRMKDVEKLVLAHDEYKNCEHSFSKLCEVIMKESNQLQAVCRDTYPPIIYSNEVSDLIINFVIAYNKAFTNFFQEENAGHNKIKVAYSFDAGSNAFIFIDESHLQTFCILLEKHFMLSQSASETLTYLSRSFDLMGYNNLSKKEWNNYLEVNFSFLFNHEKLAIPIQSIILTKPGSGPIYINDPEECLLDSQGFPK
ncbi:unnamed protein product [Gordionus sp. m RMFG-2023]|uniref:uncharacterized protein LOC135923983 n=1 Tax=Gordionus sp. m RMFG-2023 TaxID=3053472 RepID=UPI0030E033F3